MYGWWGDLVGWGMGQPPEHRTRQWTTAPSPEAQKNGEHPGVSRSTPPFHDVER